MPRRTQPSGSRRRVERGRSTYALGNFTAIPPRTPIFGATYNDNIIYAWGDVTAAGGIVADFGCNVTRLGVGTYGITLNNTQNLSQASVTVTIRNDDTTNTNALTYPTWQLKPDITLDNVCGHAEATEIGIFVTPNTFVIHTYLVGSCDLKDLPFFFKVCGR